MTLVMGGNLVIDPFIPLAPDAGNSGGKLSINAVFGTTLVSNSKP